MQRNDDETARDARITFVQGDITEQVVDAIVNAANSTLLGGGGVDGAIHRRGGAEILDECKALRASTLRNGLPAGDAVATTAGRLPAHRVIHTVGPVWRGGTHGEAEVLRRAYTNSISVATSENLKSIAFPSISTGAYGYPVEQAADVALRAVVDAVVAMGKDMTLNEIRFVLHSRQDYETYRAAYERVRAR